MRPQIVAVTRVHQTRAHRWPAVWLAWLACLLAAAPADAQEATATSVDSSYHSMQTARAALYSIEDMFGERALQRQPKGCAGDWRRTSYWEMRGASDGSPPTMAVVGDEVFHLNGFGAPEILGFARALIAEGLSSDAPPSTRCLTETMAFALAASGEPVLLGFDNFLDSVPQRLAAALRLKLKEQWPTEGIRSIGRGEEVAIITLFQLEPIEWEYRPVGFAFLFDQSQHLSGWALRTGEAVSGLPGVASPEHWAPSPTKQR